MSETLTVNGVSFDYPELSDQNWGPDATDWAVAMTSGTLQKAGGSFTLTAEVDFGVTYGLKTAYYKSRATNPAAAGQIRLGNSEVISWRNQANGADLSLTVNTSNAFQYNNITIADISSSQTLTNKTLTSPVISAVTGIATLTSADANPATTGVLRLGNTETISWRNAAHGGNLSLTVSAGDLLTFNSVGLVDLSSTQTITGKILRLPDDSAAAPGYSFSTNTGLGMYRSGTNILGFTTAGVAAGSIGATQRWVIGSTATEAQVHTISAIDTLQANAAHLICSVGAAATLPFYITRDRNDGILSLQGAAGNNVGAQLDLYGSTYGGGLNSQIRFRQAGSDVFVIDTNGLADVKVKFKAKGTATNDSAAAGYIGEYIESVQGTATNVPAATTVWGNMTSISLTAGDWDVTGLAESSGNGATVVNPVLFAVSVNSGATTTDHVSGSNQLSIQPPSAGAGINRSVSVSAYRLSLSGTTTVYWKTNQTYSVATPQVQFRLSARRVR